jgi:hypothetical protein
VIWWRVMLFAGPAPAQLPAMAECRSGRAQSAVPTPLVAQVAGGPPSHLVGSSILQGVQEELCLTQYCFICGQCARAS